MKTCTSCGRTVTDDDGLALNDGSFYCKSGGCQKKFLDGVFEKEVVPDLIRSGGKVVRLVDEKQPAQSSAIPVLENAPAEFNRECELCHKVEMDGSRYRFYYGKKTDKSFIDALLSLRGISSPPLIKDRESAWICRKCTNRRATLLRGIMAFLLVVGIVLIGTLFLYPPISIYTTPFGLLALGIFFIMVDKLRGDKEIPERLAIRIKKKALRQQGFDVFLTNKQFAKLR